MNTAHDQISTVYVNLTGDFKHADGRVGQVVSTPELSELNAFLGVLSGAISPSNIFDKVLLKISRAFTKRQGSVLEVCTSKKGNELVHTFRIVNHSPLTYEEADKLLSDSGWSLDCWSPLEISNNIGDSATGKAAQILIESLR